MLTPEQVDGIWSGIRAMAKPFYYVNDGFKWRKDRNGNERPEFWPGYNISIQKRERLEIHIIHGASPAKLLETRAPNAGPKEIKYMEDNFKQVTLTVFSDYENTLLRATNDNNFSIVVGDGSEDAKAKAEEFTEYVSTGIPEFGSVWSYVRSIITRMKALDPMGLIVTLPASMPVIETEDGLVIDPEQQLEPVPQYIEVERVWGFEYDKWYFYLTYEKSFVRRGDKDEKSGLVFNLVDDTWVWKIMQVGQAQDFTFEVVQWWEHGVGGKDHPTAPCSHLMGTPTIVQGKPIWESHYLPAGEHLDQVLLDTSYLMAIKAKLVFPHKVAVDTECKFVHPTLKTCCNGSGVHETHNDIGELRQYICTGCHGSGRVSGEGPLGEYLVQADSTIAGTPPLKVSEALAFVGPTIDSPQFLRDEIEYNLTKGRSILHLHSEQPIVGAEQATATQVGVDVRASQAFIKPIADQTFFLAEFVMDCIGWERYGDQYPGITITRPSSYDVRTEKDLEASYEFAVKNLPPAMVEEALWKFIKFVNGHEPDALRMYATLAAADTVFAASKSEIQFMLAQQVIEPWEITLHQKGLNIYMELSRAGTLQNTGDRDSDIQANAEAMRAKAKEMTPTPKAPAMDRLNALVAR
jgi:hypothetical protein